MEKINVAENLAISETGFLYLPSSGETFTSNEIGKNIIRLLQKGEDKKNIVEQVTNEYDAEIIGLIYDVLEPGAYMKQVSDRNYLIPYPSSGLDNLFQRLDYINKVETIEVLIPTLDAELYAFSKLLPKLESIGIKTFLPTKEQLDLRAKDKLFNFCTKNDIKV